MCLSCFVSMASLPNEPLLSSPTRRKTDLPCKALLLTLSLAAVISLISLVTLQFSTHHLDHPQPSDLCTQSPNLPSCLTIVSDALTGSRRPTTTGVLDTILDKSRLRLDTAIATAGIISRPINDLRQQSALADCVHLMGLSRDHISAAAAAAASAAYTDANTWLSAVLTNHVTCLDGLNGPTRSAMEAQLEELMGLASASLAVLNALSRSYNNDEALKRIVQFPSWLSCHDRKLLEASSPNAIKANVVVAQDGTGKYKTVQAAVDSAPVKGTARYVIYVKKGIYRETVRIEKTHTNLMITGDGMDSTVITGSLNFVDGTTTFNSATLAAVGTGLILQDLKIENTAGPEKHQAVALRVGADQSVINRCRIDGYQDTLYAHSLRQFYRDCSISGTVDFIFGNAAVVFQNCTVIARKGLSVQKNTVTAQGRTDPNQNTGTSIQNCQLVPGNDLVPVTGTIPTYLGRPWQLYSRTVVMQSNIGRHVNPAGWLAWDGEFALSTLYYGEYLNSGPGAGTAGRVKWSGYHVITDAKTASAFTVAALIQGGSWLSSTGVAFIEGL